MFIFYLNLFFFFWLFSIFSYLMYNYTRIINYFLFILFILFILFLIIIFNKSIIWYQVLFIFYTLAPLQISYIIGIDGISLYFLLLSVFLLIYCLLIYWFLRYMANLYCLLLLTSLWLLLNIFTCLDLFLFYIFFEGIIIPMFLLIGIWGSRSRKIYAAYQFFVYTLIGSVLVLLCFLTIYFHSGSSSFDYFNSIHFHTNRMLLFWIFMFIGFSVKVPIIPFHIWLPEAHVEAPTPGSVILAGILLKLGIYAMLRLISGSFFFISSDLIFIILIIALIGFTYASLVALNQIDIKKIIAYSSIAHMNFSLLGMFSGSLLGLSGTYFLMFGHALTSGALFLGIGILYDRYKTRLIFYYGSLAIFMPLYSIIYFILILSNFGFPGTMNFIGEFLILTGALYYSSVIVILSTFSMILTLIYSLFLYNRIFFGSLQELFIRYYCDCTRLEFFIMGSLGSLVVFFGLYPMSILSLSSSSLIKVSIIFI